MTPDLSVHPANWLPLLLAMPCPLPYFSSVHHSPLFCLTLTDCLITIYNHKREHASNEPIIPVSDVHYQHWQWCIIILSNNIIQA